MSSPTANGTPFCASQRSATCELATPCILAIEAMGSPERIAGAASASGEYAMLLRVFPDQAQESKSNNQTPESLIFNEKHFTKQSYYIDPKIVLVIKTPILRKAGSPFV